MDHANSGLEGRFDQIQHPIRRQDAQPLTLPFTQNSVHPRQEGFDKLKTDLELFASELLKTSAQHATSLDTYLEHIEKRTLKLFGDFASELRTQQNTITEDVQDKYTDFSKDVEKLMQNFGQQTQAQINTRLNEWNARTSEYTKTMTDAVKALASVVDEIEGKVGRA
jgi:hypothetical protein